MITKKMHALHESRTSADFQERIANIGLTDEFIRQNTLIPGASASILAVGSIAKGFGKPESDVDLVVIAEGSASIIQDAASIVFRDGDNGRTTAHKFFLEGVEFDVEVYSFDGLKTLSDAVNALVSTLAVPAAINALPILTRDDIRLLDMISNAWVLSGQDYHDGVKARLHTKFLPLYCSIFYYMQYLEFLEDCFALREDEPEVFCSNVRVCAQRAAAAFMSANRITDPNERWQWKYLLRLEAIESLRPVVAVFRQLIFIRSEDVFSDRIFALRLLRELGQILEHGLRSDPRLGEILNSLHKKLAYVFDENTFGRTFPNQ